MLATNSRTHSYLLAALAAAAVFCSCAGRSQPTLLPDVALPQEEAEPAPPRDTPERLHLRAAQAEEDYLAGLELIAAGEEVAGEERIVAASREMREVTAGCAHLPGCDLAPVLAVFDRLLGEQETALKTQAARVAMLELEIEQGADPEREPGTSPFVEVMPELGLTEAMVAGADLLGQVELNGPIKSALDDWLTWMRPLLLEAYENYQYLRADIAPVYAEAGLPEALLFGMIATESTGKVHSRSRAGALGLLQFMKRTGQKYGLHTVNGFDERLDPVEATRANVAYLNERFAELNNDLEKALAAYNGGEGRMLGIDRRLKGASLWDNRVYYSLPRETREYVPRVLAAAQLFLDPAKFGVRFPGIETERIDLVVREATSLNELTICLAQEGSDIGWFRALRNLNPRLEPGDRIDAGATIRVPAVAAAAYERNCLGGSLVELARELGRASHPTEPETIPYVVRRSDTLGLIATRYRCSVGEIAAINNVRPPNYIIREGQMLKIPTCR